MRDTEFDYEAQLFACARGEQAALRRIYEKEGRWLMGVTQRIVRRRELADEALHDAFLQIWQKASSYNSVLGFARGWIYSVVRNQAINTLRATTRETLSSDIEMEDLPDDIPGPLDVLSKDRESTALHLCLEGLDEQKRACLLLA